MTGKPDWLDRAREKSLASRRESQAKHDQRVAPVIAEARAAGFSWPQVAAELTRRRIRRPRGSGRWTHPQVIRIARRLGID